MHGFVRLFQGKAILLTVAVPLITAHAIAFGAGPSWSALWRLTATTIGAIGLSSTGLWLAPLVVGTALCVTFAPRLSWLKAVAWGLSSCIYPLCAALWVRAAILPASEASPLASSQPQASGLLATTTRLLELGRASFVVITNAWRYTFGSPRIALAYAACLLFAWPLARTELARRYVVAFCLFGAVFLLNPALVDFVRHNVTGVTIYGRVLWFLPIPAAFALCFASIIPQTASLRLKGLASAAVVAGLFAFFHFVPKQTALKAGRVEWSLRPKVYAAYHEIAEYLTRALPQNSYVLAPLMVSLELPQIQHHPYPILTKPSLLKQDIMLRIQLRTMISKRGLPVHGANRERFIAGLNRFRVAGIVVSRTALHTPGLEAALSSAGFSPVGEFPQYVLWTRVVAAGAHDAGPAQ